jgi:hypothetical protein
MTLLLKCKDCGYGTLQANNDAEGRMLEILKGIHNMTFKHSLETVEATAADLLLYGKVKK